MRREGPVVDAGFEEGHELRTWRTHVLNLLLTVASVAAVPVLLYVIIQAVLHAEQRPAALAFSAAYAFVVGLAFARRVHFLLRAWCLVMLSYAVGVLSFARGGLAGDGPVYLLAVPVVTVVLVGVRAGVLMALVSVLTFAAFAMTAHLGWMAKWLVVSENPLDLGDWLVGGLVFTLCLTMLVTMQWRFSRFLMKLASERNLLLRAERRQRELAEALEEAAAVVSSTLNIDEVLDHILEQVARVVPGDASNIMLVEGHYARLVRWRGYERAKKAGWFPGKLYRIDRLPTLMGMMQTGESLVIPDTAASSDWVSLQGREWLRSYVGAPIRLTGLTVGFLNVNGTKPGQFGAADALRLEAFAHHAATALQNAQLYQELRNHAVRLEERVQERTAQLQAQYAQLDAILRSSSDGIVVTDADGEIIQANPVAQAWLTWALPAGDSNRLRESVRDLSMRVHERPETVLALSGLDLQVRAGPISGPGVEGAAAVVDLEDVSHLKELDRLKSQFVSNVSHELRTPITTIKLYAQMLKRGPDKWEEHVERLEEAADWQARLIEDLLQISRVEAGRLEMRVCPASLNELADAAVVNHRALAGKHGVTLEKQLAAPGPLALMDTERMMQVLTNLVANALQYTPEGGRVEVSTDRQERDGRAWAVMRVTDTGIGIPEEEMPHIFERFFRGREPQSRNIPGTGLGLAIVKEIVDLHQGEVTVESRVGEATVFTVWLPLAREAKGQET